MNGQYGISSKVFQWRPELVERAAANVALYKRIRPVIRGADVYHLTPSPDHREPRGWMALEYVNPETHRAFVRAYRLAGGEPRRSFRLRGLEAGRRYRVTEEGRLIGTFRGDELAATGLTVTLDAEWRAAILELEPQP